MAQTVSVIGIDPNELHWIRMLILLLRHPDPSIPELARQALIYLSDSAANRALRSRRESEAPAETTDRMPGAKASVGSPMIKSALAEEDSTAGNPA